MTLKTNESVKHRKGFEFFVRVLFDFKLVFFAKDPGDKGGKESQSLISTEN